MNKMLNEIRRNWVWWTLCLLLFTISTTRNIPGFKHPLSWWNTCWIFVPIALSIFAGGNDWYILRPIRWWQWPMQHAYFEQKLNGLKDNALVYPAILWLEMNGKQAYITGGVKAVSDGLIGQGDKVATTMVDFIKQQGERHVCECHNPECDHGECGNDLTKAIEKGFSKT